MTNEAILAILALPDLPERQLRFLLALATFTRGQHGWRRAGTVLLAAKAGLSQTTAVKARGELVKAGTVEFVRGKGRGLSAYRITLPAIADHLAGADEQSTNNAGDQPTTKNAGDQPGTPTTKNAGDQQTTKNAGGQQTTKNAGDQTGTVDHQPAPRRPPTGPDLTTSPNGPASGNAFEGSYAFGSKDQGSSPPGGDGPLEGAPVAAARPAPEGRAARLAADSGEPRPRPGPGYGLCPECGGWQVARAFGGRIGRHKTDIRGGWHTCAGSQEPPVEPVPCAGCGRTGVALTSGYAGLCRACVAAAKDAEEAGP